MDPDWGKPRQCGAKNCPAYLRPEEDFCAEHECGTLYCRSANTGKSKYCSTHKCAKCGDEVIKNGHCQKHACSTQSCNGVAEKGGYCARCNGQNMASGGSNRKGHFLKGPHKGRRSSE